MKKHQVIFVPHPPIILEEIGNGREKEAINTIKGMEFLAKKIADKKPDTIIFISPHGNSFSNGTCILFEQKVCGNFESFGCKNINYSKNTNMELSSKIYKEIEDKAFNVVLLDNKIAAQYQVKVYLDHGVMVPMYFIDKYYSNYNIVHITPGFTGLEENYHIGKLIQDVINKEESNIIIICSGDLSHALSETGPYRYNEKGSFFDNLVKSGIENKNAIDLLSLDYQTIEDAAQCGLRSFLMGFGSMDGYDYESKVLSYEGPFGVGYLTGFLDLINKNHKSVLETIQDNKKNNYNIRVKNEDEYILLARRSIEFYTKTGRKLNFKYVKENFSPGFVDKCLKKRSGAFVSIHKDDMLRGCIGTISAACDNLLDEIIYNSISACSNDPRFEPVREDELYDLDIKVDILYESEEINSKEELDVKKYGVIVEKGLKRGLLLPNLEGINDVNQQVSIAMQKAGITDEKGMKLFRFEVERHEYN